MNGLKHNPLFQIRDPNGTPLQCGDMVIGVEIRNGHVDVLKADGPYVECDHLFWCETWGMPRSALIPLTREAEAMLLAAEEQGRQARWMANAN